ncbi:dTDP-glucose 4,6-dehydratase [Candidatus Desulfosporosinus infrequens]|uniref:dTDP-glucose 4,6-dehydratase n=1 Tax=Candidatus Desulfosporosinus infrequens TaxID=2043169 RepID=A0A2U3LVL7_9FIRM|nr:dTDP-glucose 4,6-dehydratase [Candidatus Desulfosporosinus infrequens]
MKILITGGAGFIGSNFIRYLLQRYPKYQLVNLDLLTYAGNPDNLKDIENHPNYSFVQGNIGDQSLVEALFTDGIDALVNFAAESHVDRSITDPSLFAHTNILGTLVLLEVAKNHSLKKFLQVSTDEVYGSLGATGCFTEDSPLAPNSPYAASKAAADLLVRAYHQTFQLPINITRCSNNYGPYQFPEKLIPLLVTHALADQKLPIYGDGLNIRDWLHVEDHCNALDLVLHHGKPGEIYNVGDRNEQTNLEIVRRILAYLEKPESLIHFVSDRLGHDRRYAIDSTKLQKSLGWLPQHKFDLGLQETVHWYVKHQDWWKNRQVHN